MTESELAADVSVADQYGVGIALVCNVANMKAWKHV